MTVELNTEALKAAVASTRTPDGFGGFGPNLCAHIIKAYLEALPPGPLFNPYDPSSPLQVRIEPFINFDEFGKPVNIVVPPEMANVNEKSNPRVIEPLASYSIPGTGTVYDVLQLDPCFKLLEVVVLRGLEYCITIIEYSSATPERVGIVLRPTNRSN